MQTSNGDWYDDKVKHFDEPLPDEERLTAEEAIQIRIDELFSTFSSDDCPR